MFWTQRELSGPRWHHRSTLGRAGRAAVAEQRGSAPASLPKGSIFFQGCLSQPSTANAFQRS